MSKVRPVRSGRDTLTPTLGFGAVVSLTSPLLSDAETMATEASIPEAIAAVNLIPEALLPDTVGNNTDSTPRSKAREGFTTDVLSNSTNPNAYHNNRPLMPKSQTTVFEKPSLPCVGVPTTSSHMPNSTSMPTFLHTPSSSIRPRPIRRPSCSDRNSVPSDASHRVPALVTSRPPPSASSYDHTPITLMSHAVPSPSTPLSHLSPSSPQFYLDHTPASSLPHLSPTTPQPYNNHSSDTPEFQSTLSPKPCQSYTGRNPNTYPFQLPISSATQSDTCNTPTSPQSSHSPSTTLPHLSPTTPQSHPSHSPVTPKTYSSNTQSNSKSHTSDVTPHDPVNDASLFNILSPDVVDLTNKGEKESSPLPSPYSPSFPTPSPSFATDEGTEVQVEDLIHLGSEEGTREKKGRSGSGKKKIRAIKPQGIEKKRNHEKLTGREIPKDHRKKSDDGLDAKERELEACWSHLLSPHLLSPPPSPTSPLSKSTKDLNSDLFPDGCVEPECKKEVFKNILYDEGSEETDDCGRLLKKEKKERKRLRKEKRRLRKAQQQMRSREHNGPVHQDDDQQKPKIKKKRRPNYGPVHEDDDQQKTEIKKKTRQKNSHDGRLRRPPPDLLSDEHDHGDKPDDDPTPPCFRRLNLPMIDDDLSHDYRLPDPSSTSSSTTSSSSSSSSGSSSSLSFDLDILGELKNKFSLQNTRNLTQYLSNYFSHTCLQIWYATFQLDVCYISFSRSYIRYSYVKRNQT